MSEPGVAPQQGIVQVAVDRPMRVALDYLPPAGYVAATVPPGVRVRVSLGRGHAVGVVVGHAQRSEMPVARLKPLEAILDPRPLFDTAALELLRWAAEYYHHPIGEVIAAALPRALRAGAPLEARAGFLLCLPAGVAALAAGEPGRAPRQRALLERIAGHAEGIAVATLTQESPAWRTAGRALIGRGWARLELRAAADGDTAAATAPMAPAGIVLPATPRHPPPALTAPQAAALAAINAAGGYAAFVLQGATGSGKTEVYLRAVAHQLAQGRRALLLVPEIGLTPQLLARFRERFTQPIAVLHSGLGDAERLAAWRAAHAGRAALVIGTRSAVFAPLPGLGLVIVDEEHDGSFKQQEGGCRYSARDLAVLRAQHAQVPVVLGSATPSFETLHNVDTGRYRRLLLPRRADQAVAPRLALIDLRSHPPRDGLAAPVLRAIERHLGAGGQALVYINRRGYAPTLLCTACGWIAPCHACDARLTVHQRAARLRCHYCGADEPLPQCCRRCGYAVRPVGQGTERIEQALAELFPAERLVRLDRDTVRRADDVEQVMRAVLDGAARILVGTQMVTKGHHFPDVTLVAVLNADQGLFSTDFRAAERLAQTIIQVAGRAGRDARRGEVLIQTEYPEHPLLQSLLTEGYEGFAASGLSERAAAHWPPFSRLALLRASATRPAPVFEFLEAARHCAATPRDVRLLGPVAATMARRAGRHHAQLLIECAGRAPLQRFLAGWVRALELRPAARRVRWALDVDPLDTQ
ncbi:MAG: primosomal protein N' [Gammaproteobacteria bacterium]|nr:primosomal protein N' [Gammaproteobacteria bacterium]